VRLNSKEAVSLLRNVLLGLALASAGGTSVAGGTAATTELDIVGEAVLFAPGIASTQYSEIRLTLNPEGDTAIWFSRDRPGGAGGYDIWMSRRKDGDWQEAQPVPFNSPSRDFDPAFSSDGRFVYFCSDRSGGMGGDDLYRVPATRTGFGQVEHLGAAVNSAGNEFAPMLSLRGDRLLFSSDRVGGSGGHDLFAARHTAVGAFAPAQRLPGAINTGAHEFDATFLQDGDTVVFARTQDFSTDRVEVFVSSPRAGRYGVGARLPPPANSSANDTYGAMLDWSDTDRITLSARRAQDNGMDLYLMRYRLRAEGTTEQ
jgi:Tol biopolymer transport system component